MPITPFHIPIANLIAKLDKKTSLSLPALIVGSMTPDLEIPVLAALTSGATDRLVLHSLIGGLTLGTTIAVALTILLYAPIANAIFPISKPKVKAKCTLSRALIVSCFAGCLSHVLLDITNHAFNPVFWPIQTATPSPIVPLLGGEVAASLITHGLMVALFVGLFFNKRQNFWENVLVG
jgi:membrane-bound metal-dependent hydrolase YbcI (DUF457 family)